MQHSIEEQTIGPHAEPMTTAIEKCVHCGFCLPTCPTYDVLGEEMDSPRGRIFLMKEVLENRLDLAEAVPYLDRCLGCVACVTACPSGVEYGELITPFRARAESQRLRPLGDRLLRWLILQTLPYPWRFRWAARTGKLMRPLRGLLPGRMKGMLGLLPDRLPKALPLPEVIPAEGERRGRVALLAGCAQQVLAPQINWATVRVLARNGVEVAVPRSQVCCGALAAHTGVAEQAKHFARQNLQAFPDDVDAVLTNAAGCGSGMHEYGLWLRGEPEREQAEAFSKRVKDVSVYLAELGIAKPPALRRALKVAYHDACHLAHAQRVTREPRELLRQIDNLELIEIPEPEICCGSAGTYNVEQPEIGAELGRKKAESILAVAPEAVVTGNIGCMTQIETHLGAAGFPLPMYHTMELLDRAYQGW